MSKPIVIGYAEVNDCLAGEGSVIINAEAFREIIEHSANSVAIGKNAKAAKGSIAIGENAISGYTKEEIEKMVSDGLISS